MTALANIGVTDSICTVDICPWNGQPMSAHPKRDRSHVPEYISFAAKGGCHQPDGSLSLGDLEHRTPDKRPLLAGRGDGCPKPEAHYSTMSLDEIKALPVADLAEPTGCHLWLWTVNSYLGEAWPICAAWGFEPLTVLTWCKPQPGVGFYLRNNNDDLAWRYPDGGVSCMWCLVVEKHSDDCAWEPIPEAWLENAAGAFHCEHGAAVATRDEYGAWTAHPCAACRSDGRP